MAGALGIRLLGPRIYDNHIADEPWVNADCPDPLPQTLRQGLALYRRAMLGCAVLIAVVAASIG